MQYELWTEDTTSGYEFWKQINIHLLDSKYKVRCFDGNASILNKLQSFSRCDVATTQYCIITDYCLDNSNTVDIYDDINDIANKYSNIHQIKITCFEYLLLSFSKLEDIIDIPERFYKSREQLLKLVFSGDNLKQFIEKDKYADLIKNCVSNIAITKKYSTERIAKSLLKSIVSKTGFSEYVIKEQDDRLAYYLGECWYKNCCIRKALDRTDILMGKDVEPQTIDKYRQRMKKINEWIETRCKIKDFGYTSKDKLQMLYENTAEIKRAVDKLNYIAENT